MINGKRVRILVEIECDQELFPGFGYDPQDFAEVAAQGAKDKLLNYNPKIITTGWGPVEPRYLSDEVARCKRCDTSEARRLIVVGQVDVNDVTVTDPAARVEVRDLVEVFDSARQSFNEWRVK